MKFGEVFINLVTNSGLVVTMAQRIDATAPVICCVASGNKSLVRDIIVGIDDDDDDGWDE